MFTIIYHNTPHPKMPRAEGKKLSVFTVTIAITITKKKIIYKLSTILVVPLAHVVYNYSTVSLMTIVSTVR